MSQYQTGTITLISGTQSVSGEGTSWLTNASVGDLIKKRGEYAFYTIGAVTSDTTITLTANYAGSSCSGELYTITKDFTDYLNAPEIWPGDKDWAYHVTEGFRIFDAAIARKAISDHGSDTAVSLISSDYNKIHLFSPAAGTIAVVNTPEVAVDDIGKYIDIRKRGSGELYIHFYSGEGKCFGESRCLNIYEETFAGIVLDLETSTTFGSTKMVGNWNFTSSGEAL